MTRDEKEKLKKRGGGRRTFAINQNAGVTAIGSQKYRVGVLIFGSIDAFKQLYHRIKISLENFKPKPNRNKLQWGGEFKDALYS